MSDTDLSIYVHIPFCIRKCNYCDFLSFPEGERNTGNMKRYMEALLTEVDALKGEVTGLGTNEVNINKKIRTVYFGGGTPNIVGARSIETILCKLKDIFSFDEEAEISIELNPGVYDEKIISGELKTLKNAGVNRLSIGLQSAQDEELKRLGRIHDLKDFLRLYEAAKDWGFENINVDLISGIPMQTKESYEKTLETVTGLKPKHISAYSLIIEDKTAFGRMDRKELELPDEDEEYEIYLMTEKLLMQSGYRRYEVSNYALEGYECRHNLVYWNRGDYLGLGLGAASLVDGIRFSNTRSMEKYLKNPGASREDIQKLTRKEEIEEFMFLGLRMTDGISVDDFQREFNKGIREIYGEVLDKYSALGLIDLSDGRVKLTHRGLDGANEIMSKFLL